MRDFHLPPPETEALAQLIDPGAWSSADSEAEAYELRYRRYEAREKAGWPNDRWPDSRKAPSVNCWVRAASTRSGRSASTAAKGS